MKRFVNLLSALALIVSMQGCGSGPSVEPDVPDNPIQSAVQLRLKGNIASIAPSTRVNESGFVANDKVGVYVSATDALSSSGNMLNNEAFTYSSGNITAPAGKEVYWGTEDTRLSVWAYYPYAENVSNNAAYPFVVHANQVGANNFYNSDFITAKATNLAPQTTPINLTFNHSLSKINVTLTAGEGITNDELAAAEKNMYIKGMIVDGTIDLSNGMASVGTTKADIMPFATDSRTYSAIVYPQQGTVTFRLEMDDDVFTYTTDVDYAAAKQYDYTLTVNVSEPQQMTLNATTINPWGDGEDFSGTMSDIISFNDDVFKNYLVNSNLYEYQANNNDNLTADYVDSGEKIDANNDGEISIAEAERVIYIDISNLGVSDMSGLESFVNLKRLYCYANKLTSLDVSNQPELEELICGMNQISSLDLSHNSKLKKLGVWDNVLSELDVTNNTELEMLQCQNNNLISLDVTKNTKLINLWLGEQDITSLDISKNTLLTELYCVQCKLSSLDVSNNILLTQLYCDMNNITQLDVTKLQALEKLTCEYNKLGALDVTNNTNLRTLFCGGNYLTSLDISKNLALQQFRCIPMMDENGNNLLATLYLAEGQNIDTGGVPDETTIAYK